MRAWGLVEIISVAYALLLPLLAYRSEWGSFVVVAAHTGWFVYNGWRPWSPWYK